MDVNTLIHIIITAMVVLWIYIIENSSKSMEEQEEPGIKGWIKQKLLAPHIILYSGLVTALVCLCICIAYRNC